MTEEELISACLRGDSPAQARLYNTYARKMMGVCLRYAGNRDEAQDILQDGFVKVFEKLSTFQGQGSFEGWIRRIIVNTALDQYRKNKQRATELDIDEVGWSVESGSDTASMVHAEELLKILQKIPVGYRVVFNLFAIEGYSHKEIAEQLGVSENTSKTQFMRARAYLKNVLETQKMI
ncbi:MAG: RNA polymerase sigma factor [Flavobacteriales bacterium]